MRGWRGAEVLSVIEDIRWCSMALMDIHNFGVRCVRRRIPFSKVRYPSPMSVACSGSLPRQIVCLAVREFKATDHAGLYGKRLHKST